MPSNLTLVGNVVSETEIRTTNSGGQIVETRIASNEGRDKTSFWTVKFLNNKAGEIFAQYAKKGSSVFISGSVEEETWIDKETGKNRSKMVCLANSFNFVGGNKQEEGSAPAPTGNKPPTRTPAKKPAPTPVGDDDGFDSVPF